jgi:hypothetical protein
VKGFQMEEACSTCKCQLGRSLFFYTCYRRRTQAAGAPPYTPPKCTSISTKPATT